MKAKKRSAISPKREENFSEWYQSVIQEAEMAETTDVRGCMVMRPWGCSIWERIQRLLDQQFKLMGHQNMYFPLLIPVSYLEKEAAHIDGFAKECAVVTHKRLESDGKGGLIPAGTLEEPYIIRPTSETLIGQKFSKWIESYRDLPLKMNQWANVMRWEMRPRLFLRTSEFLWQEGHTAHATEKEADDQALDMLECYRKFCEEVLLLPALIGEKSEGERFPGAEKTYSVEVMMQDGKALQAGTSHFLGQNFSKAFDIQFTDENEQRQWAWTTSWGVSTRLIGGLIMTHGDDDGLRLPPAIAPYQVVILPIVHDEANRHAIMEYARLLAAQIEKRSYLGEPVRVHLEQRPGQHAWSWVKKGVPMRIEIGMREMADNNLTVACRHREYRDKITMSSELLLDQLSETLDEIQSAYWSQATKHQANRVESITTLDAFYDYFKSNDAGFVKAFWVPNLDWEQRLKQDLSVSVRCMPLLDPVEHQPCVFTGQKTNCWAYFAKSY